MLNPRRGRREGADEEELEGLRSGRSANQNAVNSPGREATSDSGMSMREFIKLSLAGILAGFVFVTAMDYFLPSTPSVPNVGGAAPSPTPSILDSAPGYYKGTKAASSSTQYQEQGAQGQVPARKETSAPTPPPQPTCIRSRDLTLPLWVKMSDVRRGSLSRQTPPSDAQKFFIFEDEKALNTDLVVKCLLASIDAPLPADGTRDINVADILLQSHVQDHEHLRFALTDIALLEGFRQHPDRVYDITEASYIVLGYLPYVSFELPDTDIILDICPWLEDGLVSHADRQLAAMDVLDGLPQWSNGTTRNQFTMIHSRSLGEQGLRTSISPEVTERLVHGHVRMLTGSTTLLDKTLRKNLKKKIWKKTLGAEAFMKNVLRVPLVANPFLSKEAFTQTERSIQYFFDEVIGDAAAAKSLRNMQHQIVMSRARITGHAHAFGLMDDRKQNALLMERAEHCFVTNREVDTTDAIGMATLYDAIRAGCIPILLFDNEELPFTMQVDWTNAVYITAGASCFDKAVVEIPMLEEMTQAPQAKALHKTTLRHLLPMLEFPPAFVDPRVEAPVASGNVTATTAQRPSATHAYGVVSAILEELKLMPPRR
ncbi:Exostosin-like 1 [Hondaea fermentalgiana]|uniref:Exostosin-like 1 n=1 Tax=Hondaea fermentalgiana TaxID=2315210 RepID=A0A2R5GU54_9STRA|nr:Exostosin-like 1 [Hondaea fermentalgiana]|eukprot:GBG34380.1 Exostosin-like 1 [Hondaea fermentalgiana]